VVDYIFNNFIEFLLIVHRVVLVDEMIEANIVYLGYFVGLCDLLFKQEDGALV
jgi:hypothetical protein